MVTNLHEFSHLWSKITIFCLYVVFVNPCLAKLERVQFSLSLQLGAVTSYLYNLCTENCQRSLLYFKASGPRVDLFFLTPMYLALASVGALDNTSRVWRSGFQSAKASATINLLAFEVLQTVQEGWQSFSCCFAECSSPARQVAVCKPALWQFCSWVSQNAFVADANGCLYK